MSIHLPVLQGSYEWRMCRMGLPTGSVFCKILTPKRLEVSKDGIRTQAAKLVAERAMMEPLEVDLAGFAQRGDMLEAEAVPWYEMQKDVSVSRDGFYFDPDLLIGASPDGVTPDGGLEIKSLAPAKHLRMLTDPDTTEYMAQVQGCMWLCERDRWDLLYYHPSLPSKIITIERDEEYIGKLTAAIAALSEAIGGMMGKLHDAGVDFEPWGKHVMGLEAGEIPQGERKRKERYDMWSGDGIDGTFVKR